MAQKRNRHVLIVDGNHLAYRAHWSMMVLKNSKGSESGAFYGSLRTLRSLVIQFSPDAMFVVFDGVPKQSQALFPEYKAQRDPKRASFYRQVKHLRRALRGLAVPVIRNAESEADPIVAGLSGYIGKLVGHRVTIVSSDSDYYQCLVTNGIVQYDAIRSRTITENAVLAKYGLKRLSDFVVMKAIMGDKSDNIPPVQKGVGVKTAAMIVNSKKEFAKFSKKHSKVLLRNLKLVMLPLLYDELPNWLVSQVMKTPFRVRLKRVERLFKKYELNSFLNNLEAWSEPFTNLACRAAKARVLNRPKV